MPARRRPAAERRRDFDDVLWPYTEAQARWEAARCLGCADAPCNASCPASIDVRSVLRHIQLGDPLGAADVIRRTNVLGACSARVCRAAEGCLLRCTRARLDAPLDIPGLEWFAMRTAIDAGLRPLPVGPVSGRSVAVLGAGPAGLATAAELRRRGHQVVVYDARSEAGGCLVWSVPPFRLPRDTVRAEVDSVLAAGVELRLGQSFDSLDRLRENFDAVVVAVGLGHSARPGIDGEDLDGVFPASALLDGTVDDVGPRPVVLGGGDQALDAAGTALRLAGSKGRVTLVHRLPTRQMPVAREALLSLLEEGMLIRSLTAVERILGDPEGRVALVRCRPLDLGDPDAEGRQVPAELTGGTFDLPATSVIIAAGEVEDLGLLADLGLPEDPPRCDETGRTGVWGLYVAGDVAGRGASLATAIVSGKRAARAVDEDLEREVGSVGPFPVLGPKADLSVGFLGRTLPSPLLLAASPATNDLEIARAALRAGWAGLVLKTIGIEGAMAESKHPSIEPIADGPRMLAALGTTDMGSSSPVDAVEKRLHALKEEFPDRFVAASIASTTRDGWQKLAKRLAAAGADAIECNLACVQGALGPRPGALIGQDPALVRSVVRWVKDAAGEVPVIAKLTLQLADIAEVAAAAAEGGADALTAAGSVLGLAAVDVERNEPLPSVGGKSTTTGIVGPAILPLSLRAVVETARAVSVPVVGCGGVETWHDVVAMLSVGATTVQVCTAAMHHGLDLIETLSGGLARHMERRGIERVRDMVGSVLPAVVPYEDLVQPGAVRARVDHETCIGCGRCHISCRDGAHRAMGWDSEERRPGVDLERCVGCGLCAGVCPSDSIGFIVLGN